MTATAMVFAVVAVLVVIVIVKTAVVVPQQKAYIVERLGRYRKTLNAGFHVLLPFLDVVRDKHSLKERAIDIAEQICITRDNVQVGVDGVLYLKVMDARRASYGVADYQFAITQLAQTTLRSEIGKIDLDRTFEERTTINVAVVTELDKASYPWGIKASEAARQQQINEAEGEVTTIRAVAEARADGLREVAEATQVPGGYEAIQLRIAEDYIERFGELAKAGNTLILPATVSDVGSMIALAMNVIRRSGEDGAQT